MEISAESRAQETAMMESVCGRALLSLAVVVVVVAVASSSSSSYFIRFDEILRWYNFRALAMPRRESLLWRLFHAASSSSSRSPPPREEMRSCWAVFLSLLKYSPMCGTERQNQSHVICRNCREVREALQGYSRVARERSQSGFATPRNTFNNCRYPPDD